MSNRAQKLVRRLRTALAKFISPVGHEPDPFWDVPVRFGLKGSEALRSHLAIDESSFLLVPGSTFADARAYVIHTALDEVGKATIYLMRLRDYMEGPSFSITEDRISRLMISQIVQEQQALHRRLYEVLLTLCLFATTTNEQEYFRHLLLLEELERALSRNFDLEEFHAARSENVAFTINDTVERIREVEHSIDLSRAWYLKNRAPLPARPGLWPGKILSSTRSRMRAALPHMTDAEKLILGYSYQAGYGEASEAVHYSTSSRDPFISPNLERTMVSGMGLLCYSILIRCHELAGSPPAPILDDLRRLMAASRVSEYVRTTTTREIGVGDFVLAAGDLAEVIEIRTSTYGYQSFRVRYLAEKPIASIQTDWFPARYVQRLYAGDKLRQEITRQLQHGESPEGADRSVGVDPEMLQDTLRRALVETWRRGLREWVKTEQARRNQ